MTKPELEKSLERVKMKFFFMEGTTFLTTIMFALRIKWSSDIPTAGTNGLNILINPTFWQPLDDDERMFLLAHETWHVALEHHIMGQEMHIDPIKLNIAADHVINLMLIKAGFKMIEGGLADDKYDNMATMEVYRQLPDPDPDNPPSGGGLIGDILPNAGDKKMTPEEKQALKNEIEGILIEANTAAQMRNERTAGHIPGEVEIALDKLLNPKLPWNQILQNYMTAFAKKDYSFRKFNRRFLSSGFYMPGMDGVKVDHVGCAVDTSGSVSDHEFSSFVTEMNEIKTLMQPERMTVVDFDTDIKHIHELTENDEVVGLPFSGRGGTDLEPAFEFYRKNPPNVLLVFSDLWCDQIAEDPGFPVIWVCIDNKNAEVNFGKLIHYEVPDPI